MRRIERAVDRIESASKRLKLRESSVVESTDWSQSTEDGAKQPVSDRVARMRRVLLDNDLLSENRIIANLPRSIATNSYKMLRTRLLRRMKSNAWRVLAITSLGPAEGKTVTAINLAISIANEIDQYAFLVDLDLRRPTIARYLGLSPNPGLDEYYFGKATVDEILVRAGNGRLCIAANRKPYENSSELLASKYTEDLIADLSSVTPTGYVICDLPPLLIVDDLLAITSSVDAVLLVVAEGQSTREQLERGAEILQDVNLLGVVLNKSKDLSRTYGAAPYHYDYSVQE